MIHLNQAASIALIYVHRATDGMINMVSIEDINDFKDIINNNLEQMNTKIHNLTPDYMVDPDDLFFIYGKAGNNSEYYILKDDASSIAKRKSYIMELPLDVVIASQMDNALKCIGLEKQDNEIVKVDEKSLERTKGK